MDAQHQKTNKSAQFACYLGEHTSSSSSITSYIYLFALLFPPSIHLFLLYSAFKQDYQASKASNKERAKFFGDDLFFSFFFFGNGNKRLRQELPYLTLPYLPRYKPATANRRTVNCDLETKPLCVITQKWSMHAIICDIQFAHGVNLPIFLVTLFSFFFLFCFFSFFLHIYLNVHGTADAFDMCVFRRQVPGDT